MFKNFKTQIKNFFDAKLPFEILEEFKFFDKKYIDDKGSSFKISENHLVIDIKTKSLGLTFAFFAFFVLIFFYLTGNNEEIFNSPDIYVYIVVLIWLLLSLSYAFFTPKKLIILDREKGIFTFPHRIIGKPYIVPFNKAIVFWIGTGGVTGNLGMQLVAQHPDKKIGGANLESHETNYRKTWSFYVWYMDKNRPLPPGTAFDPYRQQDFERRKAAGFPKPLYRSHIPTPEATAEQQAERDTYWKDEIEAFTREADSVMYNPEIHKDWIRVRFMKSKETPIAHTHYKFEFEDGRIVYIKTDKDGRGFEPPKTEKFKGIKIELTESWF